MTSEPRSSRDKDSDILDFRLFGQRVHFTLRWRNNSICKLEKCTYGAWNMGVKDYTGTLPAVRHCEMKKCDQCHTKKCHTKKKCHTEKSVIPRKSAIQKKVPYQRALLEFWGRAHMQKLFRRLTLCEVGGPLILVLILLLLPLLLLLLLVSKSDTV